LLVTQDYVKLIKLTDDDGKRSIDRFDLT